MKKVLLFTLINCLMAYAIIPMNIGNKWWYQYQDGQIKYKLTKTVEKDTTINNGLQKKIRSTEYKPYGIVKTSSEFWHETETEFLIGGFYNAEYHYGCYYKVGQADTSWYEQETISSGGGITNGQIEIFNNTYLTQTYDLWVMGSGISYSSSRKTAKELGLIYYDEINLFAAEIDGVFMGDTTNIMTDISYGQPKVTTMINNYPNPFNPSTMIQFSLAKPSMMELKVYNSRGEIVKTLIKGLCNAGNQQVQFDGSSLASGVYYYRLTTPEQSMSGKMMLIK